MKIRFVNFHFQLTKLIELVKDENSGGGDSPASPAFESSTARKEKLPTLPTAPQIDAELSRSILDELESDITQPDLLMDTQIEDPALNNQIPAVKQD